AVEGFGYDDRACETVATRAHENRLLPVRGTRKKPIRLSWLNPHRHDIQVVVAEGQGERVGGLVSYEAVVLHVNRRYRLRVALQGERADQCQRCSSRAFH